MLMPPKFADNHDDYIANYLRTGERKIIGIGREVSGRRKDGEVFPMYLSVGEAKEDGEPIFVGVIHDLTHQQATEDRLRRAQRMEAIGQLTGGIAHDFNNLLAIILGNLELALEDGGAQDGVRDLIGEAHGASERGAELVRQLLAFARKQQLEPRAINLNERLPEIVLMLQRTLGEAIRVRTHEGDDLWDALVDPSQVDVSLVNLAINARDAMPNGGVLTIETANVYLDDDWHAQHTDVAAGAYVMLAVSDTGVGMTREVAAQALEPFFTTKPAGAGTGLGLSQVYGFIKQSGGQLGIYSEPGEGTTVKLYFPRAPASAARAEHRWDRTAQMPKGTESILVVEDNPEVRRLVRRQLTELGYTVHEASHGPEALAMAQSGVPLDLMFTDIVMPEGMNGYELADRVRECRPGLKVLFTSGYTAIGAGQENDSRAGGSLLSKPYRKRDLANLVRGTLDDPS